MIDKFITLALAFLPLSEARYALLYAILKDTLDPLLLALIVLANLAGALLFYFLLDFLEQFLIKKSKTLEKLHSKYIERLQRKYEHYLEKYASLALIIFIAIPLPASGAYSGAIIAKLFNEKREKYIKDAFIGIILSIAIVYALLKLSIISLDSFPKYLSFILR